MDELHLEFARFYGLSGFHRNELGGVLQSVLLQLELDKPGGQARTIDGEIDLLEDIGDGADVVLVAVGDEQTAQAGPVLHQIADIGNHAVDAVHIIARECHAAVHHDDLTAVFIDGHILADLIQTAKRNNFQFFCHIITPLMLWYHTAKVCSKTKAARRRTALLRCGREGSTPKIAVCGCDREQSPVYLIRKRIIFRKMNKNEAIFFALCTKYTTQCAICTAFLFDPM